MANLDESDKRKWVIDSAGKLIGHIQHVSTDRCWITTTDGDGLIVSKKDLSRHGEYLLHVPNAPKAPCPDIKPFHPSDIVPTFNFEWKPIFPDIVNRTDEAIAACMLTAEYLAEPKKEPNHEQAPAESFQSRLARVFGLAPDAPEDVLLSTARKVWDGVSDDLEAARMVCRADSGAIDILRRDKARLADRCGELEHQLSMERGTVAQLLLRIHELEKRDA